MMLTGQGQLWPAVAGCERFDLLAKRLKRLLVVFRGGAEVVKGIVEKGLCTNMW